MHRGCWTVIIYCVQVYCVQGELIEAPAPYHIPLPITNRFCRGRESTDLEAEELYEQAIAGLEFFIHSGSDRDRRLAEHDRAQTI
jgi:hypothetical protein